MVILKMKIGPKGQVVIPKVLRQKYNFWPGEEVIVEDSQTGVLIEKQAVDIVAIARDAARQINHKGKIDKHTLYDKMMEERFTKTGLP